MASTENSNEKKISADQIITTNSRQFISQEEKNQLASMLDAITSTSKHIMFKEVYDRDNDGLVDVAKKSLTADIVLWDNILNKPNIPASNIEQTVAKTHEHINKDILDLIGVDDNNNLTYNNESIHLPSTIMYTYNYDVDNDGIVDKALYADSTNWENIINKPLFYTPSQHSHKSTDIVGNINATTFNNKSIDRFVTVDDKIDISQINGLEKIAVTIPFIDGGGASSTFDDDDLSGSSRITVRHDNDLILKTVNPTLAKFEVCYEDNNYRHKIGNGLISWTGLPYEYNTPESINFNMFARNYISNYYDYANSDAIIVSYLPTGLTNNSNSIMYSGCVRGNDGYLYAIPFNANEVFRCKEDGSVPETFGTIPNTGSGWFGGVAWGDFIFCAPYNASGILKIDTKNKTVSIIAESRFTMQSNVGNLTAKYVGAVYSPVSGKIYFTPHDANTIAVYEPLTDDISFISCEQFVGNKANCCKAIINPIDNCIYYIPKNINKILRYNPNDWRRDPEIVATLNDIGANKFSTAVLAPNGLIYCIPSYGYNYIVIFDPNLHTFEYLQFENEVDITTSTYDFYIDAIVGPNNKLYLIPAGGKENDKIIEINLSNNQIKAVYTTSDLTERWCGGKINVNGKLVLLPYISTFTLSVDLRTKSIMPSSMMYQYFNK